MAQSTARRNAARSPAQASQGSALDQAIDETDRRSMVSRAAQRLGLETDRRDVVLRVLREQVFKPGPRWNPKTERREPQPLFTDDELQTALVLIGAYGLDPFRKEIHVTRDNRGDVMTVIGVDAWIRLVREHPDFDGFEQAYGYEEHDGEWCEVTIHSRTLSHPIRYRGYLREWIQRDRKGQPSGQWAKAPRHQLFIRCFCHAARFFSPFSGVSVELPEPTDMSESESADHSVVAEEATQAAPAEPGPPARPKVAYLKPEERAQTTRDEKLDLLREFASICPPGIEQIKAQLKIGSFSLIEDEAILQQALDMAAEWPEGGES